jgi:NAD(P)H dehydrogenase (quinone)
MIIVTGATGHLGQHVVRQLLEKVSASQIAIAVRSASKAAQFAAQGVAVRVADYSQPATVEAALAGADKVLLISSSEVGQRAAQHQAVLDAAKKVGAKQLVYTSILHAETTHMKLAAEHQYTEQAIRASGVPYTFLRNGWYTENYTERLAPVLAHGALFGATKNLPFGMAARADYAGAAVAVLTSPGHENKAYELTNAASITLTEYAAEVSRQSGKKIVYTDLPPDAFEHALIGAGLPAPFAAVLVDCDLGIARGELADSSGDLLRLIGRPITPLAESVAAGLRALG